MVIMLVGVATQKAGVCALGVSFFIGPRCETL